MRRWIGYRQKYGLVPFFVNFRFNSCRNVLGWEENCPEEQLSLGNMSGGSVRRMYVPTNLAYKLPGHNALLCSHTWVG